MLNPNYFLLQNNLDFTGKFWLAFDEVQLLKGQLNKSNQLISDLLPEGFVEADELVSEDFCDRDIAKVIVDLCMRSN